MSTPPYGGQDPTRPDPYVHGGQPDPQPYSAQPDPYAYGARPSDPYSPAPPAPYGYPQPPAPMMPAGAYPFDPLTGAPMSDKSKVAAGLLQLLPGGCLTLGGIGRLYAGHTTIGAVQLGASLVAWLCAVCGFFLFVPFIVTFGVWLWFVIDGIMILAGRSVDGQGRLLRT